MFFSVDLALAALPELGRRTRVALDALLPGGVTLLLPNPARRFALACGPEPETLGLRVPMLPPPAAALGAVRWPVLQSSANRAGGPDARRLEDVPESIREGADMLLDGGELPGTPSTVVDLCNYEATEAVVASQRYAGTGLGAETCRVTRDRDDLDIGVEAVTDFDQAKQQREQDRRREGELDQGLPAFAVSPAVPGGSQIHLP